MPSSKQLAKLRATLALLDDNTIYDELTAENGQSSNPQQQSTSIKLDAKLVQRYESLRQEYISKTIQKAVLDKLTTFDGTGFDNDNNIMDEHLLQQQQQELQHRHEQVLAAVVQAARQVHAQVVHVQTEKAVLQQRKEEILRMVDELETNQENNNDNNNNNDVDDDVDMDGSDCNKSNDKDFAESNLAELQEKKLLLQAKLHLLQQETQEIEKDTQGMLESDELQKVLSDKLRLGFDQNNDNDDDDMMAVYNQARAKLQAEREEMSQKVNENKEMITYFDGIRLVMQELGGVRLLSVEPKMHTTPNHDNNDDNVDMAPNDDDDNGLVMTVQFLKGHDVEIHLQARENETKRNVDNMRVQHARIITPTLLQGHAVATANAKDMPTTVKLEIPPLDDLVQVAKSMPDAKGLHFLVCAILDRLETMQLRVDELSILQTLAVLTHVGPTHNTTSTCGNTKNKNASLAMMVAGPVHHQDIACRLISYPLVVILRLSSDCPRRAGSVVLDQIVMVKERQDIAATTATTAFAQLDDGSKEQILDDILENLHQRQDEFTSPIQVIHAIQERVENALKK